MNSKNFDDNRNFDCFSNWCGKEVSEEMTSTGDSAESGDVLTGVAAGVGAQTVADQVDVSGAGPELGLPVPFSFQIH